MASQPTSRLTKILAVFLLISLLGNVYCALFQQTERIEEVVTLQEMMNGLERQVAGLNTRLEQDNITIRSYATQLETYREMIAKLQGELNASSSQIQGFASLQGPAVLQGPGVMQGAMINISAEIRPGEGRVLVQTKPLMGIVFQDTANTAVFLAQNITGKNLGESDVIFGVESQDQVPAVDGPSAGALMTSLVIAALEQSEPRQDITLTGTIDQNGHIGAIGGVIEKSQAAKANGKSEILLPRENARLVRYVQTSRQFGRFTVVQQRPEIVDAKTYIETEIGITVIYVDTIDDVVSRLGITVP